MGGWHRRLVLVAGAHALFGEAGPFLAATINYFQPFLRPLANATFAQRYGGALDAAGYSWVWSTTASCDAIGNLLGTLVLWYLLERLGRRDTVMVVRNLLSCLACGALALAQPLAAFELVYAGRLLTGVCASQSNAMYLFLTECAPHSLRGAMPMLLGFGAGFWELLAIVCALPYLLGTQQLWPLFMLVPVVPNLIHTALAAVFPRSPKYLYIYKQDKTAAEKAVRFYHGDNEDVAGVLADYDRESAHFEHTSADQRVSFWLILSTPHLRAPFFICIVAFLSSAFNGSQLSQQYSTVILTMLGIPRKYSLVVVMGILLATSALSAVNSFYLIERIGRRRLHLFNMTLAMLGCTCIFIAFLCNPTGGGAQSAIGPASVLGVLGWLFISLSSGLGLVTVPKILVGELCPQASRARTATAAYLANNVASLAMVLLWPPLFTALGAYSFLFIILPELACFVVLFLWLPETRHRSVADIVAQWVRPTPAATRAALEEIEPLLGDKPSETIGEVITAKIPLLGHDLHDE